MASEVFKTLDAMIPQYEDGMDMAVWAIAFRRNAVNVGCTEDLENDDDKQRPITNAVVEKKCANCKVLRAVLTQYAVRENEKVCLLIKVIDAAKTVGAMVRAGHDLFSLVPAPGMTLADWCQSVKTVCTHAGVNGVWTVCLSKFEGGCSSFQLSVIGLQHLKCTNWNELFDLCLALSSTEAGDASVAAASTSKLPSASTVAAASPKSAGRDPRRCYNCNGNGHMSAECPKPFSKSSYEYWSEREASDNVSASISKKLKEYRSKEALKKATKKKTVAAAESCSARDSGKSKEDSSSDEEDEYSQFMKFVENSKRNKKISPYMSCANSSVEGESLAKRAGTVNRKKSYSIIFDLGQGGPLCWNGS